MSSGLSGLLGTFQKDSFPHAVEVRTKETRNGFSSRSSPLTTWKFLNWYQATQVLTSTMEAEMKNRSPQVGEDWKNICGWQCMLGRQKQTGIESQPCHFQVAAPVQVAETLLHGSLSENMVITLSDYGENWLTWEQNCTHCQLHTNDRSCCARYIRCWIRNRKKMKENPMYYKTPHAIKNIITFMCLLK